MRVLIVGINGFLGRSVASECLKKGITVEGVYHIQKENVPNGCTSYPLAQMGKLCDIYDVVFMFAAAIPYPKRPVSDAELLQTNTQLPLQIALQFQKSFLVFASSVSVYGQPRVKRITERSTPINPNYYGLTKLAAESLILRYHKNTAIIRFSSLYGRGMYRDTFLPRIIEDAKKKKVITLLGDGQRKQDYIHISDASSISLLAAQHKKTGIYLGVYGTSCTNQTVATHVCSYVEGCTIRYTGIDSSPSYSYDASYTKKQLRFIPKCSIEQGIKGMI